MASRCSSHVILLTAIFVAVIALYAHQRDAIPAEDFALGPENYHSVEEWNGTVFTGSTIEQISAVVAHHAADKSRIHRIFVAWLGNSQLHTINQYKNGDHLAPYWFRTLLQAPDYIVPLGISLPNASLQEHFVLSRYVQSQLNISAMILELVYDDLREDDLRREFAAILTSELKKDVLRYPVGQHILSLAHPELRDSSTETPDQVSTDLPRDRSEDALTNLLGHVWPLWGDRQGLRVALLGDLHYLRNWALGIKPTSVRKIIRPRYERNMLALEALLGDCQQKGISVLMYVAPIRQDVKLPYDLEGYNRWKQELQGIAQHYSAHFRDLDALVPGNLWGTYHENDVDFMHFQGDAHKLLARELHRIMLPALRISDIAL